MTAQEQNASVRSELSDTAYRIVFEGDWTLRVSTPSLDPLIKEMRQSVSAHSIGFDLNGVGSFDSRLVAGILKICDAAESFGLDVDLDDLPTKVRRLVELSRGKPARNTGEESHQKKSLTVRAGEWAIEVWDGSVELATFTGEWVIGLYRLILGRAHLRKRDFFLILEEVSVQALPIVSLISFLVGLIISFLGAVTLKRFGAEFAVAYLVGYGMLREMGAIMTGIIMAGRTGAAFAAQIASMKVNEEIDALRTFGISPIEFIALPRILALSFIMPILTFYANVIGIISGWLVAEFLMGVPGPVFFTEMNAVVGVGDFLLGIFKATVFGILVATSGCLRGFQSGSSAGAVGLAATRAVVTGITLIIFSNAVIDWAAATLGV